MNARPICLAFTSLTALILGALIFAFWPNLALAQQAKMKTFVTVLPQQYLVERIGGDRVEVEALVGPGQSPHTYEPLPKQVARLAEAQVYFRIGIPFEEQLLAKVKAVRKDMLVVDCRQGVKFRTLTKEEGERGSQTDKDDRAGSPDPHIWLSPAALKVQAATIFTALSGLDPGHRAEFEKNLASFNAQIDELDYQLAITLAPFKGRSIFVFHPAFGYFADTYGLKEVSVEIEGKEPSARQIAALIDLAKKERVKVIFAQPQFPQDRAKTIAEAINGKVEIIDDLAKDVPANLQRIAAAIRGSML